MIFDYKFPASPTGQVVDDLVDHLRANLRDSNGVTLFSDERCERGEAQKIYTPAAEQCPLCHVWLDRATYKVKSVPAYPIQNGGTITLLLIAFNNDPDRGKEFARTFDDLAFWVINALAHPDVALDADNNPGIAFENTWRGFEFGEFSIVDDLTMRDRFARQYNLSEGFVLRGITLKFWTMGEIRP